MSIFVRALCASLCGACVLSIPPALAEDCAAIIQAHGAFSRAQFQCRFSYYDEGMIVAARACVRKLPQSQAKQLLRAGMESFDNKEKELGRARLCRDTLREFPDVFRP
jgi:hypothetical protein